MVVLNIWSDLASVLGRLPVFAAICVSAIVPAACDKPTFTHDDSDAAAKLAAVATNDIARNPELRPAAMALGAHIYSAACKNCHGADLKGLPAQHTSDLTNDGETAAAGGIHSEHASSPQSIQDTITSGRHPGDRTSKEKLTLGEIKAVSVYVSSFATCDAP